MQKHNLYEFTGEQPLTAVRSFETSLELEILHGPDRSLLGYLSQFANACETPTLLLDRTYDEEFLEHFLERPRLPQALEPIGFLFEIKGVSRTLTHQLVRARVGFTFSEHCSGIADFRHYDVVFPSSFASQPYLLQLAIANALRCKEAYCHALDAHEPKFTPEEARYLLPASVATHIYAYVSLDALITWYRKRICEMTQSWEMVLLAKAIRDKMESEYPTVAKFLKHPCEGVRSSCFYHSSKGTQAALSNNHSVPSVGPCSKFPVDDIEFATKHSNRSANTSEAWVDLYYQGDVPLAVDLYSSKMHTAMEGADARYHRGR